MKPSEPHQAPDSARDPIARQAIDWLVLLDSGEACDADRLAFAGWRRADPRHEAAAARLEQALGLFCGLPDTQALRQGAQQALLAHPTSRRRLLRNTLGLGLIATLGGGIVVQRHYPASYFIADHATGTGERRNVTLPDGSRLWLNARSAVDVAFGHDSRSLRLRQGELIVEVADDSRAFQVHCNHGSVEAPGGRFLMRLDTDATLVAVLRASVRIETALGVAAPLAEGGSARFDRHGVQLQNLLPSAASAWENGFIEVHDRPLGEVVAALRPYRTGLLRISEQAARVRVTGSFPLDDSDRTLDALAERLPITLQRLTGYWVSIEHA
ncbi:FecR family protein [Pseudomonas sp. ABC1]|uniref:FecR family protein n=1 Tax=Pseudomonas sp. ABC1 TaxID=2748080 RepID=UPI0015C34E18|nr:FecR family protein [Pseudomonas sp. ABC1]QLF93603.1 FecR family protein [Pseudomonas sp. ABC1]